MDENLPLENELLQYLDNDMSAGDRKQFDERLQSDQQLRERLERLQLARETVKYYGINQQVANIRRQHEQVLSKNKKSGARIFSINKSFKYALAAACVFLIVISVKYFWQNDTLPERIYQDTYVEYNVNTSRSQDNIHSPIEDDYRKKDFAGVIRLGKGATLDTKDRFLLALSYLLQNNSSAAQPLFDSLCQESKGPYRQDAEFYLALAYFKNKEYARSLPLLKKIHDDERHLYHKQVSDQTIREVEKLH